MLELEDAHDREADRRAARNSFVSPRGDVAEDRADEREDQGDAAQNLVDLREAPGRRPSPGASGGAPKPPCCSTIASIWSPFSISKSPGHCSRFTRSPSTIRRIALSSIPALLAYAVKIFRNLVVFFTLKCVSAPCESETLRSSFSSLWEDSAIVYAGGPRGAV